MIPITDRLELLDLTRELHALRRELRAMEERHADAIEQVPEVARPSARNLLHYLALRATDLRGLQERLARVGLSSLGRCEAHVLASIDAILTLLAAIVGSASPPRAEGVPSYAEGERLLESASVALLGPAPEHRRVRIMVTLGASAASDAAEVRTLVSNGADLVRINCAHDDVAAWERMIRHVHDAAASLERPCRVTMDLEGPKVRTRDVADGRVLRVGDRLHFVRAKSANGAPDQVLLSLPEVLDDVRVGERVEIDDGKLGGVVEESNSGGVLVRITHARGGHAELASEKGVNFPESELRVSGLTTKDALDAAFAARHADAVSLSFVQRVSDVRAIARLLDERRGAAAGLILKIETRLGFEALPRLLLGALGTRPLGVMIARGDLALEVGYERLAEVQEEILWICEAAHVPVIWATQVLEHLAKEGVPTRAEITDAAMAERAECVMLNKGRHAAFAVTALDDILQRMERHQKKKRSFLRALAVTRDLVDAP